MLDLILDTQGIAALCRAQCLEGALNYNSTNTVLIMTNKTYSIMIIEECRLLSPTPTPPFKTFLALNSKYERSKNWLSI